MATLPLADEPFVDIVLGEDFCEIKIEGPDGTVLKSIEESHASDVSVIRSHCSRGLKEEGPEFTIDHAGLRFRVTTMEAETGRIWFLSKIDAQVLPVTGLGLPTWFIRHILKPRLQGLVLVTGGFGAGKTTAASSMFCHRVETLGGTGIAIEDPIGEVRMAGRHGLGRVIQIPVSKRSGGYQSALQLVRRSRADLVLIGEIRDAATAIEAQDIANTDMPVFATMHASSIEEAFDKYQAYLRARHASSSEANARLALTITGVVHMTKEFTRSVDGRAAPRFVSRCLMIDRSDRASTGIIGKIRDGNFIGLGDDIESQTARQMSRRW